MRSPARRLRVIAVAACVVLAMAVVVSACKSGEPTTTELAPSSAASRLIPDQARLAAASSELRARLATSPLALFRFVNQAWTHEVCDAFGRDLEGLPTARLHGDAHVEQYAVTATARGLDDFDDSATGPAVVDIVRFLGSLELTARDRGWAASLPPIVDAFFDGYQRALADRAYLPPDPGVAKRLRAAPIPSPGAFLSWAESLMKPPAPEDVVRLDEGWSRVESYAAASGSEYTPAFLKRKKVGWLRLGIGSALARKILIRVEGPSAAPDDDVVIEAKQVAALRGVPCLSIPATGEVFRVVEGVGQIGRIEHPLLLAVPMRVSGRPDVRGWWIKTWERSYRELEIADLASAEELREVAHDAGAQLGSTNFVDSPGVLAVQKRLMERDAITRLQPRIRQVAHDLTAALLEAWQQFRTR